MQQEADTPEKTGRSNVPELTVTELSYSLKKTLEETFGRVRVRGELSRVKVHSSGHMYSDLKDDSSCLSVVCWKSQMGRLKIKPEEGLEVVCTGRVSSYPARSSYQLIIESMELAGEGALLKMLEDRRRKLAAEGLFDASRKKALPFLPDVIGVVTSPTGAVIRDIMHRLDDRFPRHVLLWPVPVQGDGAAGQIAAAIRGFNALPADGKVPRPDVLIVARGGGSLEDLMPFNEEIVVRAAAECSIPLISAVGHETDTTLIDHAADVRAPTPTAAAEMAVPRRIDIWHWVLESLQRLSRHAARCLEVYTDRLESCAARLGDPARLLEMHDQRIDHLTEKLHRVFERTLEGRQTAVDRLGARVADPRRLIEMKSQTLDHQSHKLEMVFQKRLGVYDHEVQRQYLRPPQVLIERKERDLQYVVAPLKRLTERVEQESRKSLDHYARMLENLSFKNVLKRGYVVVSDEKGEILTAAGQTRTGQNVQLLFKDDEKVAAVITDGAKKPAESAKKTPKVRQEELF